VTLLTQERNMGKILIGTCSWTDETLIQSGRFYPAHAKDAESRLRYYASQFPIVEVDSSYYAMLAEKTARLWVERTPQDFTFNIKAFRIFTQHQTEPKVLPRDIKESLPESLKSKKHLYQNHLPSFSMSCGHVLNRPFSHWTVPGSWAPSCSSFPRGST